jgi:uncharacterized membrane protein
MQKTPSPLVNICRALIYSVLTFLLAMGIACLSTCLSWWISPIEFFQTLDASFCRGMTPVLFLIFAVFLITEWKFSNENNA